MAPRQVRVLTIIILATYLRLQDIPEPDWSLTLHRLTCNTLTTQSSNSRSYHGQHHKENLLLVLVLFLKLFWNVSKIFPLLSPESSASMIENLTFSYFTGDQARTFHSQTFSNWHQRSTQLIYYYYIFYIIIVYHIIIVYYYH